MGSKTPSIQEICKAAPSSSITIGVFDQDQLVKNSEDERERERKRERETRKEAANTQGHQGKKK